MRRYIDLVEGRLDELFNTPVRLHWENHDDGDIYATCTIGGYHYNHAFMSIGTETDDVWEWVFEVDLNHGRGRKLTGWDSYGIHNTGNAAQVFAAAIQALREFIAKYVPGRIVFSADEESRRKLYGTLVRRLGSQLPNGYTADRISSGEWQISRDD